MQQIDSLANGYSRARLVGVESSNSPVQIACAHRAADEHLADWNRYHVVEPWESSLAIGKTVILLHPPLLLQGVSIHNRDREWLSAK